MVGTPAPASKAPLLGALSAAPTWPSLAPRWRKAKRAFRRLRRRRKVRDRVADNGLQASRGLVERRRPLSPGPVDVCVAKGAPLRKRRGASALARLQSLTKGGDNLERRAHGRASPGQVVGRGPSRALRSCARKAARQQLVVCWPWVGLRFSDPREEGRGDQHGADRLRATRVETLANRDE
eukprot:12816909-Alexandrium_andersonii.AAC.1